MGRAPHYILLVLVNIMEFDMAKFIWSGQETGIKLEWSY